MGKVDLRDGHDVGVTVKRLSLFITGVAVALVCGCAPGASAPTWRFTAGPCAEDFSGVAARVDCGTMVVEETRGTTNGRTVAFPIVIVRATDRSPKPDPVIYLHGGPGGDVVRGLASRVKAGRQPLTSDRDWIYFDQRGTGQSSPLLDCGQLPLSDAGVTSDEGVAALQACGQELAGKGIDLSQYNSATIALDIRDLRSALRITTYNLFGVSYGSRVAMAVMQHDPEGLRAVVLDSIWPPDGNATAPMPGLVSREVRQILRLCAADAACRGRYPDLERRFDARLAEWLKTPVVTDGKTYAADHVAAYLLDAVYDTEAARALPRSLEALLNGDFSALAKFLVAQSDYVEGQFFTHMCKEEFPFEQLAAVDGARSRRPDRRGHGAGCPPLLSRLRRLHGGTTRSGREPASCQRHSNASAHGRHRCRLPGRTGGACGHTPLPRRALQFCQPHARRQPSEPVRPRDGRPVPGQRRSTGRSHMPACRSTEVPVHVLATWSTPRRV